MGLNIKVKKQTLIQSNEIRIRCAGLTELNGNQRKVDEQDGVIQFLVSDGFMVS
jgi:hypothetical protein